VVVLRYLSDRSEVDTAEALGTSVGSVKRHAHRGLATLRTAWTGLDAESLFDTGGV
jgi:DNA-directed RNA polymerase specialized sigma24 family protein